MDYKDICDIRKKLCKENNCLNCKLYRDNTGLDIPCREFCLDYPERAEKILLDWYAEYEKEHDSAKSIEVRKTILKNAERCVLQDRNNQYGEPEDIFEDIASLWDSYTKIVFQLRADCQETKFDVCMKQILLKIVRAIHNPVHMDNYVDIAGYAACVGEIALNETINEEIQYGI